MMKKFMHIAAVLFATAIVITGCSQKKTGYANDESETSDVSTMVSEISESLPLPIDFGELFLKEIDMTADEQSAVFYVYVDDNTEGSDFGEFGGEYMAKYVVATLVACPEFFEHLDEEYDDDELEEAMQSDEKLKEALANLPNYNLLKQFLNYMQEEGIGLSIKLHSKDGYTNEIYLSPSGVKDAYIYYREILRKFEKDHTMSM